MWTEAALCSIFQEKHSICKNLSQDQTGWRSIHIIIRRTASNRCPCASLVKFRDIRPRSSTWRMQDNIPCCMLPGGPHNQLICIVCARLLYKFFPSLGSVYNLQLQFDLSGTIKAFAWAQSLRSPRNMIKQTQCKPPQLQIYKHSDTVDDLVEQNPAAIA